MSNSLLARLGLKIAMAAVLVGIGSALLSQPAYAEPRCFIRGADGITVPDVCSQSIFDLAGGRVEDGCYVTVIIGFGASTTLVDCATIDSQQQGQPPACYVRTSNAAFRRDCESDAPFSSQTLQNGTCYIAASDSATTIESIACNDAGLLALLEEGDGDEEGSPEDEEPACNPDEDPNCRPGNVADGIKCGNNGIRISILINGSNCIDGGTGLDDNPILTVLKAVLRIAGAGVGLVVAIMIIVAGLQYSAAQGNPQLIQAAKQRLMNAVIGLVMYIFAFALLNYLVPGGVIG